MRSRKNISVVRLNSFNPDEDQLILLDLSGPHQHANIYSLFPVQFLHQRAVEVMCFVPKRCNDMMNVGRLQGFQVSVQCFPSL